MYAPGTLASVGALSRHRLAHYGSTKVAGGGSAAEARAEAACSAAEARAEAAEARAERAEDRAVQLPSACMMKEPVQGYTSSTHHKRRQFV